jgi:4-hydroxy-tetrahydrodipicolinate reductase
MMGDPRSTGGPAPSPLAIIGMGQMGQAIDRLATARGWPVRARVTSRDVINPETLAGAVVAVEFTTGTTAPGNIRACLAAGCAVVSGTTGWDDHMSAVRADVQRVGGALLWASNFAVGAHLLAAAGAEVARALADQATYDAVLVETHHMRKRDAPSGTARAIEHAVATAWGRPVPITSVRAGYVPGEHELIFDGPFDQLRLIHTVRDRQVFAEGALMAAAWLAGRRGLFSIEDLLAVEPAARHGSQAGSAPNA